MGCNPNFAKQLYVGVLHWIANAALKLTSTIIRFFYFCWNIRYFHKICLLYGLWLRRHCSAWMQFAYCTRNVSWPNVSSSNCDCVQQANALNFQSAGADRLASKTLEHPQLKIRCWISFAPFEQLPRVSREKCQALNTLRLTRVLFLNFTVPLIFLNIIAIIFKLLLG